ncbi:hypothetical protein SAMN07250955_10249 [Arboricoccus pini]|uniref:Uncharacterized protein n=1 Tax=Arboricoccus pini TaxID=1963835 RepID=A0A212QN26_9PROT|nr:hypothetical protein SAMN07250955_10249 [Arboricoccus pini]
MGIAFEHIRRSLLLEPFQNEANDVGRKEVEKRWLLEPEALPKDSVFER